MATSGDALNVRLNNALSLPLQYRCDELNNIFEEFGNKELQMVLPQLLENLFGLTNQMGWGLRTMYRNSQPREFDILFRYLHPVGPLFRLCYKLLADCYVKYEFPLTYLPGKVRKLIEEGMVPPFYIDKVQLDPQTRIPISLALNSFEFYIFHFAYHLVNPWLQRMTDQSLWETLYIHLAEEYITHFLPCDGSPVPLYAGCYMYPKSSMPLQAASRPARSPTLFRQSVVLKQGTTSTSLHSSPTLPQQSSLVEIWRSESVIQVFIDFWLSYGEREVPHIGIGTQPRPCHSPLPSPQLRIPIRPSYQIYKEFRPKMGFCFCRNFSQPITSRSYLQNQVQFVPNMASRHIPHYTSPVILDNSSYYLQNQLQPQPNMVLRQYPLTEEKNVLEQTYDSKVHELKDSIAHTVADIPEHELRTTVYSIEERLLLVQEVDTYNIYDEVMADLLPSVEHIRVVRSLVKHLHYFANSTVGDLSAMDELKRIILPSSQSKIYGFMRHTIHHWPLDSSFRLILETWLSYIQPWRYTDWRARNSRTPVGRENEERLRVVDRHWINFIAENLLSYTVIFQQLLPRFARLDLATPKNSHMLFRVTKVFSQPNLNTMLSEVEHCLDEVSGVGLPNDTVSSRTNAETSHQGHKWSAVVRQQILELEGPGYQYKSMFGSETVSEVFQFMLQIQRACDMARNLQLHLENESRNRSSGFFASLRNFIFANPTDSDEYSLEERRKVSAYLETCLYHLSHIFEIDLSRLPRMSFTGEYDPYNTTCTLPSSSRMGTSSTLQGEATMETSFSRSQASTPKSALLASREWRERRKHIKYEGDPDLQPIRSTENAFLVRLLHQITSKLNEMYTLEMCHLYEQRGLLGCMARQVLRPPMVARSYDKSKPGGYSPRVEVVLPPRLSLRGFASHRTIVYMLLGMGLAWMLGYGPSAFFFLIFCAWLFIVFVRALLEPWLGSTHQSIDADTSLSPSDRNEMSFSS